MSEDQKTYYAHKDNLEAFLFANKDVAASLSKLVKKKMKSSVRAKKAQAAGYSGYANKKRKDILKTQTVMDEFDKLFHDLELAIDILIGLIISPRGATRPELIYGYKNPPIQSDALGGLLMKIQAYMDETYQIAPRLSKTLKTVMHTKGAVTRVIIPENIVDQLVNSVGMSTEAVAVENIQSAVESIYTPEGKIKSLGILGDPDGTTSKIYENYSRSASPLTAHVDDALQVEITDNYNVLKEASLRRAISETRINESVSKTTEDMDHIWHKHINPKTAKSPVLALDKIKPVRQSYSTPLYIDVPSSALIPVHEPGNPSVHSSYIGIMDDKGYFIRPERISTSIDKIVAAMEKGSTGTVISAHVNKNKDVTMSDVNDMTDLYISSVETKISTMATAGAYDSDLKFSGNSATNPIFHVMFSRALAAKKTRLVFIPASMVVYYALEFDDSGIGRSLLWKTPTLSSMRAALLYSSLTRDVRNNIPETKVNVKLGDDDIDVDSTLEMVYETTVNNHPNIYDDTLVTGADWSDWAQKIAFSYQIEEHPDLPGTRIDFEDVSRDHTIQDSKLSEQIRAQQIMSIGVSTEMVDNGFSSKFASTDEAKRIQLGRTVVARQDQVGSIVTDEVRKLAKADPNVKVMAIEYISGLENLDALISDEVKGRYEDKNARIIGVSNLTLAALDIRLPTPDTDNLDDMSSAVGAYSDFLDDALESWISEDLLIGEDVPEEITDNMDKFIAFVKASKMRQFMQDNGYLDVTDVLDLSADGESTQIVNSAATHSASIIGLGLSYMEAVDKAVKDLVPKEEEEVVAETPPAEDAAPIEDDTGGGLGVEGEDTPPADDTPPAEDDAPAEDTPPAEDDAPEDGVDI